MCLAVPGLLRERFVSDGLAMGRVDFGGVGRQVCLACVPEARVGDYVLVHVGFAIATLDAAAAARTLALVDELRAGPPTEEEDGA
jgi:hydrogenase expression/formation protein HypC